MTKLAELLWPIAMQADKLELAKTLAQVFNIQSFVWSYN